MLRWLAERRRRRLLERYAIDDGLWRAVLEDSPAFDRLSVPERARLRELTALFLADKRFFGTHGLTVTDYMCVSIASRACLLVLSLGLDYYGGWRTIVVYPGGFVAHREVEDEIGVVHTGLEALDGESMYGGAVALNWEEALPVRDHEPLDVVLHEFAHKLDEGTGDANGLPPLHADMSVTDWSDVFTRAFAAFGRWVDEDAPLPFDEYAATHPAEFFAVATEAFFLAPEAMIEQLPRVYDQLARFYRQDPGRITDRALASP
jgi:hypothetical protein